RRLPPPGRRPLGRGALQPRGGGQRPRRAVAPHRVHRHRRGRAGRQRDASMTSHGRQGGPMQKSRGALGALFSLLVVALPVVARPAAAQTGAADPARDAIEKGDKAFSDAFAKGDFKALAATYAEDAIVLPPDADMVKGRAAIES